jgi:DNA polymerase I-like protein with 3'-5' exonuclease and polymerase domains
MSLTDARMARFLGRPGVPAPSIGAREPDAFREPMSLGDDREIELDFETTGVRWWAGDRPGGCGVRRADGATDYVAWGHRGGGNTISEENAKAWFREAVRGRRVTNLSTAFEVQMARAWGCDLEELGAEVSDVAHWAGLADDRRGDRGGARFSLEALCLDFLPEAERKVKAVGGVALDPRRMMDYPASVVAVRAKADVRQVGLLKPILWRELDRLDLQRVRALEDAVMFPACEMEWNALPIDAEKLERWLGEVDEEIDASRREIALLSGTGFQEGLFGDASGFLNPDSGKQMAALFRKLGIPLAYTGRGAPSFGADVLASIDHPVIRKLARQGKLLDLRAKCLAPWSRSVKENGGLLRFRLHQCRGDEHGTVRGRFSASSEGGGSTPHQIQKPSRQRKALGDRWILRELVVPGPGGGLLASADAMQIEYRIFASYSGSRALREAYARDPMLQFHEKTREMIQAFKPGVDYDGAKTCNFLTVYGGGLAKLALQLGNITKAQHAALYREFPMDPASNRWGPPKDHPLLASTLAVKEAYDRALPEVRPLARRATDLAKSRGWVVDVLGRRATFPGGEGAHAALNAVIQPSAAEVMKTKMVEVHRERKRLGLTPRLTLHDEWLGGCESAESARGLAEILNRQSFERFRDIPILWDTKVGRNWASCTSELEAEFESGLGDMGADGKWCGKARP